jgi:sugar diacid utilization regulator/predicted hydrocarbon binding protein
MDRAKGFLLRLGWHYGNNISKHLTEIFPLQSQRHWLYAGADIHGMTGYVTVKVKELKFDPATQDYYCEGYWYNSVEAEQHIKHFGYHHEPVCFQLIGTVSGYVSTHVGRKVIFKEIQCMGKGDPFCYVIGKPVEDWGKEIVGELSYYEEENLAQELDRAFLRIEKQKEILNRAFKINEKLSKVLLEGGGLKAVVRALGEEVKHTVMIEDKNFNLLESYGEYRKHNILEFMHSHRYGVNEGKLIHQLLNEKRTVQLTVPEQAGGCHHRLISPIIVKNEVLGYISLLKEDGTYDEMEYICLERASTICAIQLLYERRALDTERQIKGELLNEFIRGTYNEEELTYRMQLLGYDLKQDHYVFLFNIEHTNSFIGKEEYLLDLKKQISESIDAQVRKWGHHCLMATKVNQIIALIPHEMIRKSRMGVKAFGQLLVEKISIRDKNIHFTLGISSLCQQIKDLKRGFEEAEKGIEVLKLKKDSLKVIYFGELGSIGKMLCSENLSHLEQYALERLKEVKSYDEKYNAELLKTLYYYMENKGNMHKTSRDLNISLGAIRYRIKRIQELSCLDLSNSQDFFDAHLALQISILLGKIQFH